MDTMPLQRTVCYNTVQAVIQHGERAKVATKIFAISDETEIKFLSPKLSAYQFS
jgi:hypothetical protein